MKPYCFGLLVFLLTVLLSSVSVLNAQEINLDDWDILDPWEESCQSTGLSTDLNNAEGKLLTNISSKAFTWLTGTKEQAEYEPIGELANYFGFAKFRNEIRDSSNNPLADENLRGASWLVVLEHLDSNQRQLLYNTALAQEEDFLAFLESRVDLINILYGLKEDESIILAEAIANVDSMSTYEANISAVSAEGFGEVSLSLESEQVDFFETIRSGSSIVTELLGTGPYVDDVEVELEQFTSFQKELLKETASKFLSYETGSLEDAIFLPSGKIGNFFGFAHYRYEERAIVNRSQAADLLYSILTDEQEQILKCLTKQVFSLEQGYISARAQLITDLYPFKIGEDINENLVIENYILGARDEGRMGIVQAIYFDFLERILSDQQIEDLQILRETTGETTSSEELYTNNSEITFFPNPFDSHSTITITLDRPGWVTFVVYDLQGKQIEKVIDGSTNSGSHAVEWNSSALASGSYLYIFRFNDKSSNSFLEKNGLILRL